MISPISIGSKLLQINKSPSESLERISKRKCFNKLSSYAIYLNAPNLKESVGIYKNCTQETIFGLGSLTKLFTAALSLKFLNPKASLKDFGYGESLPEASISQLLTHTSGILDYRNVQTVNELKRLLNAPDTDELIQIMLSKNKGLEGTKPEGDSHLYSNSNYLLLQKLLESKTSKTFRELMSEFILPKGESMGFLSDINVNYLSRPYRQILFFKKDLSNYDPGVRLGIGDSGLLSNIESLEKCFRDTVDDPHFLQSHNEIKTPIGTSGQCYGAGLIDNGDEVYWHNGQVPSCWNSLAIYDKTEQIFLGVLQTLNGKQNIKPLTPEILNEI
ncbi:MAG: serine hydrolase domain-containing protein [Candidatus Caenarcaniphilales bacterium]|nr:serine hydrolase domain-containing protein [Candidatus Caenarcaniphilales bacterium]